MTRSMLKDKGLQNKFWAQAISTTVYLLNRCSTKTVTNKTLVKAWSRRKPLVKHLKVFSSMLHSYSRLKNE